MWLRLPVREYPRTPAGGHAKLGPIGMSADVLAEQQTVGPLGVPAMAELHHQTVRSFVTCAWLYGLSTQTPPMPDTVVMHCSQLVIAGHGTLRSCHLPLKTRSTSDSPDEEPRHSARRPAYHYS